MTDAFPVNRPSGCPFDPASEYATSVRRLAHGTAGRPAEFARIPTLRLAVPFGELQFKDNTLVYGVTALPVTWDTPLRSAI